ncbi:GNAT family N-acetyltransferase [Marinilactibacillus sp. Marseille-P9653]|uniref:GNAT family N-acetyltransferase n=1 Tax=Marinilactibacillus sp. Marseille-P9653 TaxID=2866583 RepID=UPI001CE46AAE|nr:GNAT family N-acetyltransferase [Marinilactibacillus sp. Marseille-P9653]
MNKEIRQLNKFDYDQYKSMQTGLDDDYMLAVYPSLTDGDNRLFGLFVDEQLVSTAGYSVFANHFIMLGRLRSDVRYRGKNYATEILEYVKALSLQLPEVAFVGANTEKHNLPAQKVLSKIGLPHVTTLYAAQTTDLSPLLSDEDSTVWTKLTDLGRKQNWLAQTYLSDSFSKKVFPFEAYYPFPASEKLFSKELLEKWDFYENDDQTRYVILWEEDKGGHYLHVTYPWDDFTQQKPLWNTVQSYYSKALLENSETTVWIDLTETEAELLPNNHPFELPSPWMLHGVSGEQHRNTSEPKSVDVSLSEAYQSIEFLENELKELENELDEKLEKANEIEHSLKEMDFEN